MSVPNQKKIIIERSSEGARKDFLKVSNENLKLAIHNLKPSAFMLWVYFTDNANGYSMDLYPVDFMDLTGLSRSTYDRSFRELKDKGYLIQSKVNKNLYMFKERSESDSIMELDNIWSIDKESMEEVREKYFNQNE